MVTQYNQQLKLLEVSMLNFNLFVVIRGEYAKLQSFRSY